MRKLLICTIALFMAASIASASEKLDLKTITSGKLAAQRMSGLIPIDGTDQYARIVDDGKKIVQYSFKTGKETAVLFDAEHTQGEKLHHVTRWPQDADTDKDEVHLPEVFHGGFLHIHYSKQKVGAVV